MARFALKHYLGVVERDPGPLPYNDARAREIAGSYENDAMTLIIATDRKQLTIAAGIKPEIRAAADSELPPDLPPAELGLLPGDTDHYIVTHGGLKGQRGFFTSDGRGAIVGADLAGRLFNRVPTVSGGSSVSTDTSGQPRKRSRTSRVALGQAGVAGWLSERLQPRSSERFRRRKRSLSQRRARGR